ncbi:hypothetical protein FACS1894200_06840 [Spirochaetia bacterium]|nr:hypothetical protein FACS1894200_06840 [Spirochaetia bacterium]
MSNVDFVIDDKKKDIIADAFNVKRESVDSVYQLFLEIAGCIKYQYLAHIMRAMEVYFRDKTRNPLFVIICKPYGKQVKNQMDCSANYYTGRRFVIFYNPAIDDRKRRVYIAHELGHLFLIAMRDIATKDKRKDVYEGTTEPLSSIFGIFTISDKNDFYKNIDDCEINHANWKAVLDDFLDIK